MFRKILFAVLILVGVLAGFAFYLLNDEEFLKEQVHTQVEKATGRSLTIDGTLDLKFGRTFSLEANGIHFSNAPWATRPDMVEVGRLSISVDLPSLLSDKFIIHAIEVDKCQVNLEVNEQGLANWEFSSSTAEVHVSEPIAEEEPQGEPRFQISLARLGDCQLRHESPKREKPLLVDIQKLTLARQESGRYLNHAQGVIDGIPLTFDGNLGPMRALWQGGEFHQEIKMQLGQIALQSSGVIADMKTLTGADLTATFSGPDIGLIIEDLALPPISHGAFDFKLDLNTVGAMTRVDIKGDLGSLEANAEGSLDRLLHPTTGQMKMELSGPNLGALVEVFGIAGLVEDPFSVEMDASVKSGRTTLNPVILSTEKDRLEVNGTVGAFPDFVDTQLEIQLHSKETDRWASIMKTQLGPIDLLDATIQLATDASGNTTVDGKLQQSSADFNVSGSLGQYPQLDQPDFQIDLKTPNLQDLGKILKIDGLPASPLSIAGRVSTVPAGIKLEKVLADLSGDHFNIDGTVNLSDQFAGSRLTIKADVKSTARLGQLFGQSDIPDQPLRLTSTISPVGKGLKFNVSDGQVGEMKLALDGQIQDLDHPHLIDSDFDIGLPSLAILGFLVPDTKLPDLPFSASGKVRNLRGSVTLQDTNINLGQTSATVDARYQPGETLAGSSLEFRAAGADIRELLPLEELESLPHNFQISGKWSGTTEGDLLENVEIRLGEMTLTVDGGAVSLPELEGLSLNTHLSIADVSVLNTLLDQPFKADPLSLSTSLIGDHDQLSFKNIKLTVGPSDLSGELDIDRREKLGISGKLDSYLLDLRLFDAKEEPPETLVEEVKGTSSESNQRSSTHMVFDDTPIKALNESPLDLDLRITARKANYLYTELENIDLGIVWQDYSFTLNPIKVKGNQGSEISGNLSFNGTDSVPKMILNLTGKDIRIGLTAVEGQDPATYPPIEMHVDLIGSGHTRREMASSLDGTIRMFWGSGLYAAQGVGLIFSDFMTELLSALNPFATTSEYSSLECGVFAADVESGMMTLEPILIQDEKITIVSKGTVDLNTEMLDLVFNTKPRKGFGISAGVIINSLIKVGGTLSKPGVQLDAGSAVISGGTAVATVGISLLAISFSDRFLSSKDPCGDARKKLAERDSKK